MLLNFIFSIFLTGTTHSAFAVEKTSYDCEHGLTLKKSYRQYFGESDTALNKEQLEILFQLKESMDPQSRRAVIKKQKQAEVIHLITQQPVTIGQTFSQAQFQNILFRAFYRLAIKFAEFRHSAHPTVPLEDLVQSAMTALFLTTQEYKSDSRHMFSSWAWIKMKREVDTTIASHEEAFSSKPKEWYDFLKVKAIVAKFKVANTAAPSISQIQSEFYQKTKRSISEEDVRRLIFRLRLSRVSRAVVYDNTFYDETGSRDNQHEIETLDSVPSDGEELDTYIAREQVIAVLKKTFSGQRFSENGLSFLSLFYGIDFLPADKLRRYPDDGDQVSVSAIALRYGLSPQRVAEVMRDTVDRARKKIMNYGLSISEEILLRECAREGI